MKIVNFPGPPPVADPDRDDRHQLYRIMVQDLLEVTRQLREAQPGISEKRALKIATTLVASMWNVPES